MPPHGRRRASLSGVLVLLLSFLSITLAAPSAIGIDLGTENFKAALIKPGSPLDIVLAKDSKRKDPAIIAFKPTKATASSKDDEFPERLWGSDAVAIAPRFPADAYPNLKPLLGLSAANDPVVKLYEERYPSLSLRAAKDRGTVSIKSEVFKEDEETFTVEELLAMQLQNVRNNAEAMAGSTVRDVVFTIPAYFTAEEKQAVQTAAELAKLKILAMTTDGLAVGLNYATSRTFPIVSKGEKPEYHVVFDMGAGSATATVLRFQGRDIKDIGKFNKTIQEVQVVGTGWDKTFGGDTLNTLILNDMIETLAEHKEMKAAGTTVADIKKHGKTMAKLWKEAQRQRQVLSANTETQGSFEGLYHPDLVFKYKISRATFEKMAANLESRVSAPILQALEMAKLGLQDIESVILHGGAQRTPFVQKALEAAIGSAEKLKTNVNSDESAAFGAAFKAAGLVPGFRVKEIRTSEAAVFPVSMTYLVEGKERHQAIFGSTSLAGKEKQVPFKDLEDFTISLSQQSPYPEGNAKTIPVSSITTTNLTAGVKELQEKFACEAADIKTQLSLRLSPVTGLPEVTGGSVSCEALVEQKKAGVMDGVKGMFGFGKKDDEQKPLNEGPEDVESATAEEEAATSTESSAEASATDAKDEKTKEPQKKLQVVYVGVKTERIGQPLISSAEMTKIKDRMRAFDQSDKNRKLREEALNSLEGYAYKVRDFLEDEGFIAVSSKKERDAIEKKAVAAGEWIYGDGSEAKLKDFTARLKELKDLVGPIQERKEEGSQRPEKLEQLRDVLNQTKGMIEGMFKEYEEKKVKLEAAAVEKSASAASAASEAAASPSSETVAEQSSEGDAEASSTDAATDSAAEDAAEADQALEDLVYTEEEMTGYQKRFDDLQKWYDEKSAAQAKLKPTDVPAIKIADISEQSEKVQKLIVDVITKQMDSFGTKGKKKSSKAKSKSKSTKKSSAKKTKTASDAEASESQTQTESAAQEKPTIKDEL